MKIMSKQEAVNMVLGELDTMSSNISESKETLELINDSIEFDSFDVEDDYIAVINTLTKISQSLEEVLSINDKHRQ